MGLFGKQQGNRSPTRATFGVRSCLLLMKNIKGQIAKQKTFKAMDFESSNDIAGLMIQCVHERRKGYLRASATECGNNYDPNADFIKSGKDSLREKARCFFVVLLYAVSILAFTGCAHTITLDNNPTLDCEYFRNAHSEVLTPYEKCGYVENGKMVLFPGFLKRLDFSVHGLASAWIDNSKWVYIKRDGTVIPTIMYDNGPDYFQEGMARYREKDKLGFIDEKGEVVIPAQFEWAFPFKDGIAEVCEGFTWVSDGEYSRPVGGRWGAIDKTGSVVIPINLTRPKLNEEVIKIRRK